MGIKNLFAQSKRLTELEDRIEVLERKFKNLQLDNDDLYSKLEIFSKRWQKRAKVALDKEAEQQELPADLDYRKGMGKADILAHFRKVKGG